MIEANYRGKRYWVVRDNTHIYVKCVRLVQREGIDLMGFRPRHKQVWKFETLYVEKAYGVASSVDFRMENIAKSIEEEGPSVLSFIRDENVKLMHKKKKLVQKYPRYPMLVRMIKVIYASYADGTRGKELTRPELELIEYASEGLHMSLKEINSILQRPEIDVKRARLRICAGAGDRYTEEENKKIKNGVLKGLSPEMISAIVNRPYFGVLRRINKMKQTGEL